MKFFVLGIDGCQEELFLRFKMPFMQSVIKNGFKVVIKEDLISRGWTEICTGMHAKDCGGYYERMVGAGNYIRSSNYNLLEEKSLNKKITTIWDELNGRGYSVGIMNVPTTNPAPEVNGFFVSGGGGGKNVTDMIAPDQCYPSGTKAILDAQSYIVDERVPTLLFDKKLYDPADFFKQLMLMTERRVDSYIALNQIYNVDFGFIVFRSVVVVENILASEIERYQAGDQEVNEDLIKNVELFYLHLDQSLEKLCSVLKPEKICFVADHGTVVQRYSVNLNTFLRSYSFQYPPKSDKKILAILKRYKDLLPNSIKNVLKKNRGISDRYAEIIDFCPSTSLAFNINCGTSFLGIFVNDERRFGGCVPVCEIDSVAEDIVESFNSDPTAGRHRLVARKDFGELVGDYSHLWPDVIVEVPEGYSPSSPGRGFVEKFKRSSIKIVLEDVKSDLWTGTKGRFPLSTFVNVDHVGLERFHGSDLTCIYDIVLNEFECMGVK
jgi:predicted AlkP superfamily phosphohydrolase/phosphomutase